MAIEIRQAVIRDVPEITELYNYYVINTPITFDLEPRTLAERTDWFSQFDHHGRYQLWIATEEERVVGYACSHRFREKEAYQTSIEATIYLHHDATGKKLGSRLYGALFESLAGLEVHRVLAGVTLPNAASVALHQKMGFEQIGRFSEVGFKFGRYWDVAWFEKPL